MNTPEFKQRTKFEDEFGALYFAPYPDPELYKVGTAPLSVDQGIKTIDTKTNQLSEVAYVNDMKSFFQDVPNVKCVANGKFPEIIKEMSRDCNCRCGSAYDVQTGKCEKQTRIAGSSCILSDMTYYYYSYNSANKVIRYSHYLLLILSLLLLFLLFFVAVLDKCRHQEVRTRESKEKLFSFSRSSH